MLAVGESRLELLWGYAATAGDNDLPLPSTRPPPSFLADILRQTCEDVVGFAIEGSTGSNADSRRPTGLI